jgi:MFS family permease
MTLVAVPWQIYRLTHSVVAVGMVGLAVGIPLIVFSILGGALADRMERKRLIGWMQVGLMATAAALTVVAMSSHPSLVWIYGLVALSSVFGAIERPARSAMLPLLMPEGRLASALALRQVSFQTTQIVGPALGGLLIASFSIVWVYAFDTITFLAALAALFWLPRSMPERAEEQSPWETIKEGITFTLRTPLILSIFTVDLIAMIFGMPRAVFPALASETFHAGARGAGLLYAAPAVGALIGALLSGWVKHVRRHGAAVIAAVIAWGAFITLAGLSTFSILVCCAFLALAGAADVVSAVFRGTMLLEATPDPLRGRVSALNLMVVIGGPRLGDVEAGVVAGAIGAAGSIVFGGVACLAGTAILAATATRFRRYSAPSVETRTEPTSEPTP